MSSTDVLGPFIFHVFIVYPAVNYILKPGHFPRRRAIAYAIGLLVCIELVQMGLESSQSVNHYERLGVTRTAVTIDLKRAFKRLSLELHPDKNKSPSAPEEFQRVKHSYDVLMDAGSRKIYEKLGEEGIKLSTQHVLDNKQLLLRLIVSYFSHAIMTFLLTIAEPSGDVMFTSIVGMLAMLFLEASICFDKLVVPGWFLLQTTPHEVLSHMHRAFPAFLNGCRCARRLSYICSDDKLRCIYGSLYTDPIKARGAYLVGLCSSQKVVLQSVFGLSQPIMGAHEFNGNGTSYAQESVAESALRVLRQRWGASDASPTLVGEDGIQTVEETMAQVTQFDPNSTRLDERKGWSYWTHLALYLLVHYFLFHKPEDSRS